jgi:hypothetical protein
MKDNLAQLIKNEQVGEESPATDFENHETAQVEDGSSEEVVEEQSLTIESDNPNEIGVIMLSEWFETNNSNFTRVNRLKIQVQGVKPDSRLLCSVLDPKGGIDEDNHPIRNLELIKDANIFPVLDLPGYDMDVYGNGFLIMYSYGSDIVLKCYGIKTGLIIVFCVHINNQLIPYARTKLKKKDNGINIIQPNRNYIRANILSELDMEGFQIQYKQVLKELDQITDKQSAITWLLSKQTSIRDINHLLQIDDIIRWLIA